MKNEDWVSQLVPDEMSQEAFDSLPEYSCTNPTGVYPGKVWKRNLNAYRFDLGPDRKRLWVVCEFVADGPDYCKTEFRRPVIKEKK